MRSSFSRGYYADFDHLEEQSNKLGRALAEGFAYQGQMRPHEGMPVGEPSGGLPSTSFVACMQDHDQVGIRVKGDRFTMLVSDAAVRALSAVYSLLPQYPWCSWLKSGEREAVFLRRANELREVVRKSRQKEPQGTPEHEDPTKSNVTEAVDSPSQWRRIVSP